MNYIFGALLCFLMACGGGSGSEEPEVIIEINPFEPLVGVWDETYETEEGLVNEHYVVITFQGQYKIYDYQGDSYDQGDNCYDLYSWQMISYGNNEFGFQGLDYTLYLSVSGDILTTWNDEESGDTPRIDLTTSDFTPLCES
jgi:hypothetical protein